jgi:uncharacterized repeat protein (TIGR01451 family)
MIRKPVAQNLQRTIIVFTLLGILFFSAGFGGLSGASAQPPKSSDHGAAARLSASDGWETYRDPEFDFSTLYPSAWQLSEGRIVDPYTYVWEVRFTRPSDSEYVSIAINVSPLENPETADERLAKKIEANGYSKTQMEEAGVVETITINGIQSVEARFQNNHSLMVVFVHDNFEYTFFLQQEPYVFSDPGALSQEDLVQNEQIFETLVSSFIPGDKTPSLASKKIGSAARMPNAATADSFAYPVGYDWTFAYGAHPTFWSGQYSDCFQTDKQNLFHAGQDRGKPANTTVSAVANGQVYWYDSGYATYPGRVVIIQHTLSNGSTVFSMYGHLGTVAVYSGQEVTKGMAVGTMLDQGSNTHLHWEIRYNGIMGNIYPNASCNSNWAPGPGYTYPNTPESYGYTNPSDFVASHQGGSSCPGPSLNSPGDGYVSSSQTITFSWSALSGCTYSGYTFRIKDTSNMDSGGTVIVDTGEGGTSRTETISSSWNNRDLYWGVRAANAPNGANWTVRRFRIEPGATCNPTADQVALYTDGGYSGTCKVLGIGDYSNPSALGFPNDSASSIKVGSSVKLTLCKDDNYAGGCEDFTGDDSNLSDNGIGNDTVSSAKVASRSTCPSISGVVRLYDGVNCTGSTIDSAVGLLQLELNGFNDRAESIAIPSGWSARLYQNNNENSDEGSLCMTSNDSNLNDNTFINGGAVGNQATWLRVFDNNICAIATSPDLIIQSITASPASPSVNQAVTFTVRVKNQGTANAASSFDVDFFVDTVSGSCYSEGYAYKPIASLASGSTADLTFDYPGFTTSGTHTLYAFADSFCSVTESNEGNNILGPQNITVTAAATPPSAPALSSPSNGTTYNRTDSIALAWNTSSGATQYYAEFWGGPSINLNSGWVSGTSWSLGSQWGGTYQWRVKAKNSSGESGWSETRTLYIKYGSPSSLTATASSATQVNLSWGASADAPGNIDGYRVYRNGSAVGTVTGSTTSFSDTGLTCNTSYSYAVKAYKGSSESDASNTSTATTNTCTVTGDSYEPDNTGSESKWIYAGSPQSHSIVPATDVDWVKFTLAETSAITLATTGSTGADTRIWLYDGSLAQIDFNDDNGFDLYSSIDRVCGVDALPAGTYFVKADEYGNNSEISAYMLSFNIIEACSSSSASMTFTSTGVNDGWILEYSETANKGGTMNNSATTLSIGDDKYDKQYRGILSFDTSALPEGAEILSAQIEIKRYAIVGTNPIDTHYGLACDLRWGYFGSGAGLALPDFKAAASYGSAGIFAASADGWYSAPLFSSAYSYINTEGFTQCRLRFLRDDNDDRGADILKIYSGNSSIYQPVLIVEYRMP